jgi:DNA primase
LADDWADLIKQVKEANDIVDVVGDYVALRQAGSTFVGLCPFHDDHNPSFRVDPRWQNYRCWSCGKYGDVFSFVQEHDRVGFKEALELLARRAGIAIHKEGPSPEARRRALLLDVMRWAELQFQECLRYEPTAEEARQYIAERKLTGETVRRFGIGFAPLAGDWLVQKARKDDVPFDLLETVGLIAPRQGGNGFYDRFRDRVMFPIRDPRGQTVGFGGRILPSSPYASRAPKYYNSAETPLFSKSQCLYGLDEARQAGAKAGYLAVVEGYTDVLMAHQLGVTNVVSTMGTALNAHHVQHLRRFAPHRVVLVFDADAGGATGVDRALDIFASQDVDLAIATLPAGMDPCDLLVQHGAEPFREALGGAVDALDFKLSRVLARDSSQGVEGQRRAVDAVLAIIALAPELAGQAGAIKRELMVTRIAHRLGLREELVWARLNELRERRRRSARKDAQGEKPEEPDRARPKRPPATEERELLEVLLAEPALVPVAAARLAPEQIKHPVMRDLVAALYRLHAAGEPPELDQLRLEIDDPELSDKLLRLQFVGRQHPDRRASLNKILTAFRERQVLTETKELQNQLRAAGDHDQALALLRQLQNQTASLDADAPTAVGAAS